MAEQLATVTGMKKFKGEVEGKQYDSTTIFVQVKLYAADGSARGSCTQEYKCGTSEIFDRLSRVELPAEFKLTMDTVSNGKTTRQIVSEITPVAQKVAAVAK